MFSSSQCQRFYFLDVNSIISAMKSKEKFQRLFFSPLAQRKTKNIFYVTDCSSSLFFPKQSKKLTFLFLLLEGKQISKVQLRTLDPVRGEHVIFSVLRSSKQRPFSTPEDMFILLKARLIDWNHAVVLACKNRSNMPENSEKPLCLLSD